MRFDELIHMKKNVTKSCGWVRILMQQTIVMESDMCERGNFHNRLLKITSMCLEAATEREKQMTQYCCIISVCWQNYPFALSEVYVFKVPFFSSKFFRFGAMPVEMCFFILCFYWNRLQLEKIVFSCKYQFCAAKWSKHMGIIGNHLFRLWLLSLCADTFNRVHYYRM